MGRAQGRLAARPEYEFDVLKDGRASVRAVTIRFEFDDDESRDERIRESAKMGLPQKAIAEAFGIGQPQVSKILAKHTRGIKRRLRRRR